MEEKPTFYDILGVSPASEPEIIKQAYKKLALRYHPDREDGDGSKFIEIREAYEVLSDSVKRLEYDKSLYGREYNRKFASVYERKLREIFFEGLEQKITKLRVERRAKRAKI